MAITRTTPLQNLSELLRAEELAAWADVSKGCVYSAVKDGTLPCVRLGHLVRIPRSAIAAWLNPAQERAS